MIVGKEFKFHAAHRDAEAPEGDQCGRLHGHTYVLSVEVSGPLDARGMIVHGDVLKQIYRCHVEPVVEHQYLNEALDFNPTMEAVASWLQHVFTRWLGEYGYENLSVIVTLWETPTMFAVSP